MDIWNYTDNKNSLGREEGYRGVIRCDLQKFKELAIIL